MEQAKDEVLNELVSILKGATDLEVRLGRVLRALRREQICKNEGLCREINDIKPKIYDIEDTLVEIMDKYFNVCEKVREVYKACFHSHGGWRIAVVSDCYDEADDYAQKQFGIGADRCLNRGD